MARHTFFSFHYQRDVQRASVVRNSWVTKSDRKEAGFFEDGLWEAAARPEGGGVRRLINRGMSGTSVTCVCIGNETWARYWVRYELLRTFAEGKGLLGVRVHNIANFDGETDEPGHNPFDYLAFTVESKGIRLKRKFKGEWGPHEHFPDLLPSVPYDLRGKKNHTFSSLFKVYDWSAGGYHDLGDWTEAAARQAGR